MTARIKGSRLILNCFISVIACLLFSACCSEVEQVNRPSSEVKHSEVDISLTIEADYRAQKYPIVIKTAEEFIRTNPESWEIHLFLGLAYFNYGDHEKAKSIFNSIPPESRNRLTDSCLELQVINTAQSNAEVIEMSETFFPDCINDLKKPNLPPEPLKLDSDLVLKLGKMYDAEIAKEDNPQKRKLIEKEFIRKHKLTEEELTEISARYLEMISLE